MHTYDRHPHDAARADYRVRAECTLKPHKVRVSTVSQSPNMNPKSRTCGRSVTARNKNVHRCAFVAWAATFFEPATQCCWCNKRLPSQATDAFKNDFSNLLSSQSIHTRTSFVWLKHWMHSTPSTSFFPQYLSCKIHLRFGMCKLCIHLFHLCYAKLTGYLCPWLMWHRSTRK